jgi:hypothetical protein
MAYINDNGLGRWGGFRRIANVVRKSVAVAVAPTRMVFSGARAAVRGRSIGKAVNKQFQPIKAAVIKAAPVLQFVPVYGTAISAIVALEKLRAARAAAKEDAKQTGAIDAQIAQVNAQIDKLQTQQRARAPAITANARVGKQISANNAISAQAAGDSHTTAEKIVAVDKKIPWGVLATIGTLAIAALKK